MTGPQQALALLMLGVAIGEQLRWRRPRGGSAWVAEAGSAVGYGLLAGLLMGRLAPAVFTAAAVGLAGALRVLALRALPAGILRGACLAGLPYLAVWLAWAGWQAAPHPAALEVLTWVAAHLTGVPVSPDRAAAAAAVGAAYLFNLAGATALTRAVLGVDGAPAVPYALALREAAAVADEPRSEQLYRAGRVIGELERLLVLSLVLRGELAAVGFVIAAKSIVRWEMTRRHAEYFLIGTLTSVGVAVATGLLIRALIGGLVP